VDPTVSLVLARF